MSSKLAFASTFTRGEVDKNAKAKSYAKEPYLFSLMAETDIYLAGASFLGLHKDSKEEKASVVIYTEVKESPIPNKVGLILTTLLSRRGYPATLKKEESVVVELPYLVKVAKNNWIDIGFSIDYTDPKVLSKGEMVWGPSTQKLEEKSKWVHTHFRDGVRFHTTCSRSPLQLEKLFFFVGK